MGDLVLLNQCKVVAGGQQLIVLKSIASLQKLSEITSMTYELN